MYLNRRHKFSQRCQRTRLLERHGACHFNGSFGRAKIVCSTGLDCIVPMPSIVFTRCSMVLILLLRTKPPQSLCQTGLLVLGVGRLGAEARHGGTTERASALLCLARTRLPLVAVGGMARCAFAVVPVCTASCQTPLTITCNGRERKTWLGLPLSWFLERRKRRSQVSTNTRLKKGFTVSTQSFTLRRADGSYPTR
jgi:hypothetical protein